ncbi:MAG: class I SAM-dependent RNA methyltransferase [Ruminococcaceae bacterium]|nr:class I SAM-dependent RNA methyltransferase [Oscillospiraceae bacterium]
MEYLYTATCLFGLEGLLGQEIDDLGFRRVETIDGRITFAGDENGAATAAVNLRFAERLYLHITSYTARTFTELFDGASDVPWEDYIPKNGQFPVKGHSIKSTLFSVPDCQKILKKSLAVRLGRHYGVKFMPETGDLYQVEFFILKDKVSLMIDITGTPLHKRGYRPERVTAPLRETLAAALAKLSRPREDVLLWDPFCGSGTIAIEAAMMMKNIAPGARLRFSGEATGLFPANSWNDAREAAIAAELTETGFRARATDINPECVRIAGDSAKRAGVSDIIEIFEKDALTIETGGMRGTIVTNPPYGERLMTVDTAEQLYRDMGSHFKTLDRWQIYVITQNEDFAQLYGRRPDKVRKLYNGMIPCYFYQFFKNNK